MPSFDSTFNPSVNYFATPENHAAIEAILATLESWERGYAGDLIFQIVVTHRIVKGKAILDTLRRRYPDAGQEPVAPDDQDALLMRTYVAEALTRDERSASVIYDQMQSVEQMREVSPEIQQRTLEAMERNIDRALLSDDAANEKVLRAEAYYACVRDQPT